MIASQKNWCQKELDTIHSWFLKKYLNKLGKRINILNVTKNVYLQQCLISY